MPISKGDYGKRCSAIRGVNYARDQSAIGNWQLAITMRHTLSIVVADQPGELSRIVGLFSARGFNIETVSVGPTFDPRWSRVTVVTHGDDRTIEQIVKQCSRLARVREVEDVTMQPHIEREMALIDVAATPGATRQEVLSLVAVFRAKVVDISQTGMIVEASGNKEKVEALIELLRPVGIRDITRTGCIAIGRLSNVQVGPPNEIDSFEFPAPGLEPGTQNSELKT